MATLIHGVCRGILVASIGTAHDAPVDYKKERKERLEERRERLNEIVDREEEEEDAVAPYLKNQRRAEEPVYVGDRVFYQADIETNFWKRAVVKDAITLEGEPGFSLLPVERSDVASSRVNAPASRVIKDKDEWILRYKIGEKVACNGPDGWESATVTQWFPVDNMWDDIIDSYKCLKDKNDEESPYLFVPWDNDEYIVKCPQAFWFSVGDDVLVVLVLAGVEQWIPGKVTKVHVTGWIAKYAVYECRFKDGTTAKRCHILKDTDEHVASPTSSPRERLLESIEQNCRYNHLDYLIKSFGLDVMAFRELLLSKAIESASYDALLWLQENAEVDLEKIRDAENNGLLHQIAKSPHAERFFESAAEREWKKNDYGIDDLYIMLDDFSPNNEEASLIRQRNNQGRTFLHDLVISENRRSLGLALSPNKGLAWVLSSWLQFPRMGRANDESFPDVDVVTRDNNGVNLKSTARLLGRYEMEKMIGEFSEFQILYDLSMSIQYIVREVDGFPNLAKFGNVSLSSVATRFIRFQNEWASKRPKINGLRLDIVYTVSHLSREGRFQILRWLIEEDSSLLETSVLAVCLPNDRNEFTQHVTAEAVSNRVDPAEVLDLVGHAAAGERYFVCEDFDTKDLDLYYSLLDRYSSELSFDSENSRQMSSLLLFLESQRDAFSSDHTFARMLDNKKQLLLDDKRLSGRLRILDYLVKEKSLPPPSALSVIRWRQCGVLRWLVENSFVALEEKVCTDPVIAREGEGMSFIAGRRIPNSMSVGAFLCFAAIEFDDLQSFEWLVGTQKIQLSSLQFEKLNAVHLCAFLGRAEIFLWLMESPASLKELSQEECIRGRWRGYYAAHIAAKRGFTFLAELLISSGCPVEDDNGKAAFDYAKQSKVESVLKWADAMERPLFWKRTSRSCFTFSPRKNLMLMISRGISLRLLSPPSNSIFCEEYEWITFWLCGPFGTTQPSVDSIDRTALLKFATDQNNDVLCRTLKQRWTQDIACNEPIEKNHLLRYLLKKHQSEPPLCSALKLFRDELLCVDALGKVVQEALSELRRLFAQGSHSRYISEMIQLTTEVATEIDLKGGRKNRYFDGEVISADGRINLDAFFPDCDYDKDHPLCGMILWREAPPASLERLYLVLAIEGYSELISWVRSGGRSKWDAAKETSVVRIAAYLGHLDVVDIFLKRSPSDVFSLSDSDCYKTALLGAAEAGRVSDVALYWHELG